MHDSYDDELDELEEMITDGQVWACCPQCLLFISSAFQDNCAYCKTKIDIDKLIIKLVDWSNPN